MSIERIAKELNLRTQQVSAIAELLADGATVPFIARYRKEATGSCDEVQVAAVRDALAAQAAFDKRIKAMLGSLQERQLLTPELERHLRQAKDLADLEDRYQPFRPKRRTRAMLARERGLQPLADALWSGQALEPDAFVDVDKEVPDRDAALAGMRDIIAERIAEDVPLRQNLSRWYERDAEVRAKVVAKKRNDEEAARFRDWFDWQEPLQRAPSHRVLALLRGADAKILRISVVADEDRAVNQLRQAFQPRNEAHRQEWEQVYQDAWSRLIAPSLSNAVLSAAKRRADADAIGIFQDNLQELLLAAPLGSKRVLAVDPGLRTGCKIAVLNEQGDMLAHQVLHLATDRGGHAAGEALRHLVQTHQVAAIGIGNGTASRETEACVRDLGLDIPVCIVDESGASVYSASAVAREEFPDLDLTVRGAISIGRRLQDPLAELVKVDPKAIGVGQYQHDVDQTALKNSLDDTVERCVNQVGVELNSASSQLLAYVSGLGPKLAQAIVSYRQEHGAFASRQELKKVPRLGAKAFEQSAGFLRIRDGKQLLDSSAVHPERYELVRRMAKDAGADIKALMQNAQLRAGIDLRQYQGDGIGEPTLRDILAELAKPGRDPRPGFTSFSFADVHRMEDLQVGMVIPGIVTNVTAFGAFVDVGVHQDGLVHISQLADRFVKDPGDVVKVRQQVQVRVLEVDLQRKRIGLSMRSEA